MTTSTSAAASAPTPASAPTAVRGPLIRFRADPFRTGNADALVHEADGLLICEGGRITAAGPYAALRDRLPPGTEPVHYSGHLITPGFIDAHTHYVQKEAIAAFGAQLPDWLDRTYVTEERFADGAHARRVASSFCDELLRNGTTTALVFASVHADSADALFEEATRRGMRVAAGKVWMDRNAPDALLDTAQRAYDESSSLIQRWHGKGRNLYAITPRFAPTSTPDQLEAAGALRAAHPTTLVHTHISEHRDEIPWVSSLFPDRDGYLDVYDHYGLLGPRTVLAHGIHLTPAERDHCARSGTAVAHCPSSNLYLGSGLFPLREAKEGDHPLTVALGTDIGAGTSFALLQTMRDAHQVAKLRDHTLDAVKSFYLATRGGAEALGLADTIGSLTPGQEADFTVLDPQATPLLADRTTQADTIEDLLFALTILGDDRAVRATYTAGKLAYDRDAETPFMAD